MNTIPHRAEEIITQEYQRSLKQILKETSRLLACLEEEKKAEEAWRTKLDSIIDSAWSNLIKEMKLRYEKEHKTAIKRKIQGVFYKYDILAKPRRYLVRIVSFPFRLTGLWEEKHSIESKDKDLLKVRSRIDNSPVLAAIDSLHRLVLEQLSPADEGALLYSALREEAIAPGEEEISAKIAHQQELLAHWLSEKFRLLAEGIPSHKKLGIYSTSILWGIIILSFETVLGGGISLLEAAFDSVFAPFVTKGSVELFAYGELKKITRELNEQYEEGLWSIIEERKNIYIRSIQESTTPEDVMKSLYAQRKRIKDLR